MKDVVCDAKSSYCTLVDEECFECAKEKTESAIIIMDDNYSTLVFCSHEPYSTDCCCTLLNPNMVK